MKTLLAATFSCHWLAFLAVGEIEKMPSAPKGPVKLRPTHEALEADQKKVEIDPRIKVPEKPIDLKPATSGKSKSLLERSVMITDGKSWTLVPKGAVLHVPKHLTGRVGKGKSSKLVPWAAFHKQNSGWLQALPVSLAQARGDEAFSEATEKFYQNCGRVVVAVLHDGPISVKGRGVSEEPAEKGGRLTNASSSR